MNKTDEIRCHNILLHFWTSECGKPGIPSYRILPLIFNLYYGYSKDLGQFKLWQKEVEFPSDFPILILRIMWEVCDIFIYPNESKCIYSTYLSIWLQMHIYWDVHVWMTENICVLSFPRNQQTLLINKCLLSECYNFNGSLQLSFKHLLCIRNSPYIISLNYCPI